MDQNITECTCLEALPFAMAYVPIQKWGDQYAPAVAMDRGTIFPNLDYPFIGEEAVPDERR